MNKISQLLRLIQNTPDCFVRPSQGLPQIKSDHNMPNDLVEFYQLCGGVVFYQSSAYSIEIVPPSGVVLANAKFFIGLNEKDLAAIKDDISWSWYIIGDGGENLRYITIDLASERLGRCYDSFWDSYAMPGSSPIIALSFTDLLSNLHSNKGQHWYWCQPGFLQIGDAYG